MPGSPTSTSAISGRKRAISSNAAAALSLSATSWPSVSSSSFRHSRESASSSTTSTRCLDATCALRRSALAAGFARGRLIVKVLPLPSPSLAATTLPPWSETRRSTSASPSPRPRCSRSAGCAPCTKGRKSWACRSGAMPWPSSWTARRAPRSSADTVTVMLLPPYLVALSSRFSIICLSRTGSASTQASAPATTIEVPFGTSAR